MQLRGEHVEELLDQVESLVQHLHAAVHLITDRAAYVTYLSISISLSIYIYLVYLSAIYMRIYLHLHLYSIYISTSIYLPIYTHIYIDTHTYIHIYAHTHTHIYIYTYMSKSSLIKSRRLFSTSTRLSTCRETARGSLNLPSIYPYMGVDTHTYIHICAHTNTHTHTHTHTHMSKSSLIKSSRLFSTSTLLSICNKRDRR